MAGEEISRSCGRGGAWRRRALLSPSSCNSSRPGHVTQSHTSPSEPHQRPPRCLVVHAFLRLTMALRPAHETKHVPLLQYPFRSHIFHLVQLDNGATNGTGLWLGAQCMSLYLSDLLKNKSSTSTSGPFAGAKRRNRAIELGSGIGLSACVTIAACPGARPPTPSNNLCSPAFLASHWHPWAGT